MRLLSASKQGEVDFPLPPTLLCAVLFSVARSSLDCIDRVRRLNAHHARVHVRRENFHHNAVQMRFTKAMPSVACEIKFHSAVQAVSEASGEALIL